METTLGIVLLKSVGAAYSALNLSGKGYAVEVMELAPLGAKSQVIVKGELAQVKKFLNALRTADIERSMVLKNVSQTLIRSYLSLESCSLGKFVAIIEGDFAGDLLSVGQNLLNCEAEIFDFRVQRTTGSPSYLIITGSDMGKVRDELKSLKGKKLKVTLIEEPSKAFIEFLDVPVSE